jgi:predicted lysophospholipase L1 biosynthesis ABC-type transport system permease subunit
MPQTLANHRRWSPVYHFFVAPVLLAYFAFMLWEAIRAPSLASVADAVVALAIGLGAAMGRVFALTVQNRLVRLEERLRLARVLAPDLLAESQRLTTSQLIALRFAPDAELPDLVRRTLAGEFPDGAAIKRAVRDWRADYLRV